MPNHAYMKGSLWHMFWPRLVSSLCNREKNKEANKQNPASSKGLKNTMCLRSARRWLVTGIVIVYPMIWKCLQWKQEARSSAMESFLMESSSCLTRIPPVNFWWVFTNPPCDDITFVCSLNHTGCSKHLIWWYTAISLLLSICYLFFCLI